MVLASAPGKVAYVSAEKIIVSKDGSVPGKNASADEAQVYDLRKFMRSNAGTCINQKPIVRVGDTV